MKKYRNLSYLVFIGNTVLYITSKGTKLCTYSKIYENRRVKNLAFDIDFCT
jgi:hypothetical protein